MNPSLLLVVFLGWTPGIRAQPPAAVRAPNDLKALYLVAPEPARPLQFPLNHRAKPPRQDDFIGDRNEAGDTYYDYQTNGTVGKMIAVDSLGGVHVTWMDGYDADNEPRHQKYNYFNEIGRAHV
jgi:hypothetical protein